MCLSIDSGSAAGDVEDAPGLGQLPGTVKQPEGSHSGP